MNIRTETDEEFEKRVIATEQARIIAAAIRYGHEMRYCSEVITALRHVFPNVKDEDFRDSDGLDYRGLDPDGYTKEGWNIYTGKNRAGELNPEFAGGATYWCDSCRKFE